MLSKIRVISDDITNFLVDPIVNAAKDSLRPDGHRGGVSHRVSGPKLPEEQRRLRDCTTVANLDCEPG